MSVVPFARCAALGATLMLLCGCELVFGVGSGDPGADAGANQTADGDGGAPPTPAEDPGAGYLAEPEGDGQACGSDEGGNDVACEGEDACIVPERNVCGPAVDDVYTAYELGQGPECGDLPIQSDPKCEQGDLCRSAEDRACASSSDGSFYLSTVEGEGPPCGESNLVVRCEGGDLCLLAAEDLCGTASDGSYTAYLLAGGPECGTFPIPGAVYCEIGAVCDSVEENLCLSSGGVRVSATSISDESERGPFCGLVEVGAPVRCQPGDLCVDPETRICR